MQGPGNQLVTRITGQRAVIVQDEDPTAIFGAMARVTSNSRKSRKPQDKLDASRDFYAIYAAEFRGIELATVFARISDGPARRCNHGGRRYR